MYNLSYYKAENFDEIVQFIHQHPFLILTGVDKDNKAVATQVPIIIANQNGRLYLKDHIMKNTDYDLAFVQNSNVLALFTESHTYVGTIWYTNPHGGSTWNYLSVYAHGQIRYGDSNELATLLQSLSIQYEKNYELSPPPFSITFQKIIRRK